MSARKRVDYDRIEAGWRAGLLSPRQLAAAYAEETGDKVSHTAIIKHFTSRDIPRDLAAKIHAKAEAMVTEAMVTGEVTPNTKIPEKRIVDEGATIVADVKLAHRRDIHRKRAIVGRLMDELERQIGPETAVLLDELGDMLRNPDDAGQDKLNDLYRKIISLPERAKTAKLLAETLRITVDMERQAFGMDAKNPAGEGAQGTRDMTDAERAVRVAAVLNGGGAPALLEALRARRSGA